MKKKVLLISVLSIMIIIGTVITMNKQSVIAEEDFQSKSAIPREQEENLTIQKAVERAKIDPEFWNAENGNDDSLTVLAVGGGFLKGEMEDSENGVVFNSDTDPNATTLGEIRKAVSEYTN